MIYQKQEDDSKSLLQSTGQSSATHDASRVALEIQVAKLQAAAAAAAQELARRDESILDLRAKLAEQETIASSLASIRVTVAAQNARLETLNRRIDELHIDSMEQWDGSSADAAYRKMVRQLRDLIRSHIPPEATALVISKGDEALLRWHECQFWHFPQQADGAYAGFNPADSGSAIVQLEALRSRGANFLVIPATASWWLDHYEGFRRHLQRHYPLVAAVSDNSAIYDLRRRSASHPAEVTIESTVMEFQRRFDRDPVILDWTSGLDLSTRLGHQCVFSPPESVPLESAPALPYLDGTIDVVAGRFPTPAALAEARRVARCAIVTVKQSAGGELAPPMEVEWLSPGEAAGLPSASIIIPTYNGAGLVDACLVALVESLPPGFRGEILVLDDASTDETSTLVQGWIRRDHRIRYERNLNNVGFLLTCNRAAALATGDVLIFLNNDTLPQDGWLTPLLRMFNERLDAGAVGGKLVYPDGRLQDAGGVIFSDGTGANFGRNDYHVDHPLYNYVREVDYATGAMLATRREIFNSLGGFDPIYQPAYYEETDYCFRLREKGYKIYYQPASVIIHLEGMSCGTDIGSGIKQHQGVNRARFVQRWSEVLVRHPANPGMFGTATWHALATREAETQDGATETRTRRAMFLAPLMPEFDRESGSKRIYDLIRLLRQENWAVSFVSKNPTAGERYAAALRQMGVAVYRGMGSNVEQLIANGKLDLAVIAFWNIAEEYTPIVRRLSPRTHVIADSIDLHFMRNARKKLSARENLDPGFGEDVARELNAYAAADGVLTVSQKEADLIGDFCADSTLAHAVPDGEELEPSPVPFEDRNGIVFVGNFRHGPNVDAVEFLCKEIIPRIDPDLLARHPISIVGNALDDRIMAMGAGLPHVQMVGWVPCVLPYLSNARISIIPLRYGAGTKRKLLQSMMLGTPAVSTSVGIEGLNLEDQRHVLTANDAETFAAAISRLIDDQRVWTELSREGGKQVRGIHRIANVQTRLVDAIAKVSAKIPKVPRELAPVLNYQELVSSVKKTVCQTAPPGAIVAVVSKGDSALLELDGRQGLHFPQDSHGNFAGHYPANSADAVKYLEQLRARGVQFLVFPKTALWWLDYYAGLRQYLSQECRLVCPARDICLIYEIPGVVPAENAKRARQHAKVGD